MARSLRFTEYIKKVANRAKLSERSVRKVYDAMFEIVTEELRFADEIRLKRFGTFYTVQKGGTDKRIPNPDGSWSVRYIEPYQNVRFKPSGEFKNYINGKLIDKESKRRERNNKLTRNEKKLLRYKTDDRDRNLAMAIEKLSKGE
jgi:nucleoid DNA-binding protein